jgi:hypothetical protein
LVTVKIKIKRQNEMRHDMNYKTAIRLLAGLFLTAVEQGPLEFVLHANAVLLHIRSSQVGVRQCQRST